MGVSVTARVFAALLFIALFGSAWAASKHTPPIQPEPGAHMLGYASSAPLQSAVKQPYTAPTPADPAQVVTVSPNSPYSGPLGQSAKDTSVPVAIAVDQSPISIVNTPGTTGGLNNYFFQPTAALLQVNIKPTAGLVYKIRVSNNSTTAGAYLRLYNFGAGFAGCSSATNLIYATQIPAAPAANMSGLLDDNWAQGLGGFTNGISLCVSGAYATTDVTAPTASALDVNIGWQ